MGKRDGTLVDTWFWEYEGVEAMGPMRDPEDGPGDEDRPKRPALVKGKKVPIEVRIIKSFDSSSGPPRAVKEVQFSVGSKDLDIWVNGTDIECLRQVLWGKLDKRLEIKWQEYILVQIGSAQGFYSGLETGFSLGESTIWKGTAHDGTLILREVGDYGRTSRFWQYRPWPGECVNKEGKVLACIPASVKNKAALKEFHERIDALRDRLSELIKPEQILHTLADLSSRTALPAPREKHGDEGR